MGPIQQKQDIQLDSVQRRTARFVSNNFQDREPGAVTSIISKLKWESLEQRSAKARYVLMYKIVHNFVEIHAEHLLIPADSRTRGIAGYIHEQVYITFPSSLVQSSHGTAYHQMYVRLILSASSRQG